MFRWGGQSGSETCGAAPGGHPESAHPVEASQPGASEAQQGERILIKIAAIAAAFVAGAASAVLALGVAGTIEEEQDTHNWPWSVDTV